MPKCRYCEEVSILEIIIPLLPCQEEIHVCARCFREIVPKRRYSCLTCKKLELYAKGYAEVNGENFLFYCSRECCEKWKKQDVPIDATPTKFVKCANCSKIAQSNFRLLIPNFSFEVECCSEKCTIALRAKYKVCLCGKVGGLICSRCQNTFYCGHDCFKSNWKEHKKICVKSEIN